MATPSTLIIRLSAMGDVALTVGVVAASASKTEVLFLTKAPFHKFFENIPGVTTIVAQTGGKHRGLTGIFRLWLQIRRGHRIDRVIDLHDVIRSRLLSTLFRLSGCSVARIRKGRSEKRKFISQPGQNFLPHTTERYLDTFSRAGLSCPHYYEKGFVFTTEEAEGAKTFIEAAGVNGGVRAVGIAPFARHATKQWPLEKLAELLRIILDETNSAVFLFGGPDELNMLQQLAGEFESGVTIVSGLGLRGDIALIREMSFMITMDSSNLHIAALCGVSTVSIWGGTHPGTGFYPVGAQKQLRMEISPA